MVLGHGIYAHDYRSSNRSWPLDFRRLATSCSSPRNASTRGAFQRPTPSRTNRPTKGRPIWQWHLARPNPATQRSSSLCRICPEARDSLPCPSGLSQGWSVVWTSLGCFRFALRSAARRSAPSRFNSAIAITAATWQEEGSRSRCSFAGAMRASNCHRSLCCSRPGPTSACRRHPTAKRGRAIPRLAPESWC